MKYGNHRGTMVTRLVCRYYLSNIYFKLYMFYSSYCYLVNIFILIKNSLTGFDCVVFELKSNGYIQNLRYYAYKIIYNQMWFSLYFISCISLNIILRKISMENISNLCTLYTCSRARNFTHI